MKMGGQIRNQDQVTHLDLNKNIFEKQTSGSQHLDFDTGSHNSAPQPARNIRRINKTFNVIVLTLDCLLNIKGAF